MAVFPKKTKEESKPQTDSPVGLAKVHNKETGLAHWLMCFPDGSWLAIPYNGESEANEINMAAFVDSGSKDSEIWSRYYFIDEA